MPGQVSAAAIVVAAGRGLRAGGGSGKQWRDLLGRSVVERALAPFRDNPRIGEIVVVTPAGDVGRVPGVRCVAGGATRSESVASGLAALDGRGVRDVLVHDAARPLVTRELIDRVLDALGEGEAAAPGLPVTDALWTAKGSLIQGIMPRDGLWRAQTPQGFRLDRIASAHRAWPEAADDVEVALAAGLDVRLVAGDEENLKITYPEDFARAERILRQREGLARVRLGNGYDVHRFGPGDHVMLCGVRVPHDRALVGHSDADVGLHALSDAIYGALADGDIGRHFPPSDPKWKGAESHVFLRHAAGRAAARGYAIANLDLTLVCERPKIGPHSDAMRGMVAEICGIDVDRVSVKATTSERLGFTGREEGIVALATAALVQA